MRPGSLSCGERGCQCRSPGGKLHDPCWSLTFKADGKTVARPLRPDQVDTARQQIANYRRFQALSAELFEISEQICRACLAQTADAAEQAEKTLSRVLSEWKLRANPAAKTIVAGSSITTHPARFDMSGPQPAARMVPSVRPVETQQADACEDRCREHGPHQYPVEYPLSRRVGDSS